MSILDDVRNRCRPPRAAEFPQCNDNWRVGNHLDGLPRTHPSRRRMGFGRSVENQPGRLQYLYTIRYIGMGDSLRQETGT